MPLGYGEELNIVNLGDTAQIVAVVYDTTGKPVAQTSLSGVEFHIQLPDLTKQGPFTGTIQSDGSGSYNFNGTTEVGHYPVVATFTFTSGVIQSVRADFQVQDPFDESSPSLSPSYVVATHIWSRVEDCFDADEEGPWLQDVTLNTFNKEKMESFLDMALFDINWLNPPTTLALTDFVLTNPVSNDISTTPNTPLIIQGGYIVCLRHLMSAYVEQPNPVGAQIAWQDRRDYLQRWQQVYAIEFQQYDRMAKLFKRQYLGLGQVKSLISSKAGRLLPAPMRTQFVGRGFW